MHAYIQVLSVFLFFSLRTWLQVCVAAESWPVIYSFWLYEVDGPSLQCCVSSSVDGIQWWFFNKCYWQNIPASYCPKAEAVFEPYSPTLYNSVLVCVFNSRCSWLWCYTLKEWKMRKTMNSYVIISMSNV